MHLLLARGLSNSVMPFASETAASPSDEEVTRLIEATHKKKSASRTRVFKRDLPASWSRFLMGLVSLALVCSDIPRSGLGFRDLSTLYPRLDPDTMNFFGSAWNYSIVEFTREQAASSSARVWSYKFDSTSYCWRAVAEFFQLAAFPPCVLYHGECPRARLDGQTVFGMVDSVASAVAAVSTATNRSRGATEPVVVALRTDGIYRDRIHNFLLSNLFLIHIWRTNQALHYAPTNLAALRARDSDDICSGRGARPNFCSDQWINFRYSCPADDEACKAVGLIHAHILQRVRDVELRFPHLTVDLTLLESNEDKQNVRGGLSTLSVRRADITSIIRARECTAGSTNDCTTEFVSDYRYEIGMLSTDAPQWFSSTAVLRVVGQSYFYFRVLGLFLSCYFVQAPKTSRIDELSLRTRLRQTIRLFMKVPMQIVVYGSPFPICCYVMAHLIDSPVSYSVLENRFISQNGMFDISVEQFVSLAVIQMRNVWVYALLLHTMLQTGVASRWVGWYRRTGVYGVPEFLLSALSCVTISAQFRSTKFRCSKILAIFPIVPNYRHSVQAVKYQETYVHRGAGNTMMGGLTIDLKYLVCELFVIAGVLLIGAAVLLLLRRCGFVSVPKPSEVIQTHTPVPYSAGILWPTVSLCVHWTYDFFSIRQENADRVRTNSTLVVPLRELRGSSFAKLQRSVRSFVQLAKYPTTHMGSSTFQYIQFQMKTLHDRRSDVEGNIAFMNLALMSDPIVYFYLHCAGGRVRQLGYYQSLLYPTQVTLLPRKAVHEENEHAADLKLLRPVAVSDLTWSELVQCG